MSLTAPERETVINWSDDQSTATIWTAQRRIITKLKRNPAARLLDEGSHGLSAWALFEFPADLLTFRTPRKAQTLSDEERAKRAERLRRGREGRA